MPTQTGRSVVSSSSSDRWAVHSRLGASLPTFASGYGRLRFQERLSASCMAETGAEPNVRFPMTG